MATLAMMAATRLPGAGRILGRLASAIPRPTGTGPWLIATQTTQRSAWATGSGQARGTAALAELAADRLATSGLGPGVHTLHRIMTLDARTLADLAHHGIAVAIQRN